MKEVSLFFSYFVLVGPYKYGHSNFKWPGRIVLSLMFKSLFSALVNTTQDKSESYMHCD